MLQGFCREPWREERIVVTSDGQFLLLRLATIDWLEASDNHVILHTGQQTRRLRGDLAALAAKLPPGRFLWISPSTLVNVGQIKDLRRLCQGEWRVLLRNGARLTARVELKASCPFAGLPTSAPASRGASTFNWRAKWHSQTR